MDADVDVFKDVSFGVHVGTVRGDDRVVANDARAYLRRRRSSGKRYTRWVRLARARREDDALAFVAAPDALMALACRATARYDARGVDADAVLPRHRLDVLAELAPEMPTIHYLKHAEALHRRDFPAARRAFTSTL